MPHLTLSNGWVILRSGVLGIFNFRTRTEKGTELSTAKQKPMRVHETEPNSGGDVDEAGVKRPTDRKYLAHPGVP